MAEKNPFASPSPYAARYGVLSRIPETGRPRAEILAELEEMAAEEDPIWSEGRCSGTAYCGDHDHYAFLNASAGLFSHSNAIQRDMCPSASRFESEIVAMTLDLMHADAAGPEASPCGALTTGGTESILTAMLVYRDWGRVVKHIDAPQLILPTTGHPAFEKAGHLFGIEVIRAPVDPVTTRVDLDFVRDHVTERTVALIGSAGNYPYGTIDSIEGLGAIAQEHDIGLHVDGCLGGYILPWGEALGYPIPPFDFRVPGVTSISADTHKYGYGLKGASVIVYRDRALRRYQYFMTPNWQGGKYFSPGLSGSRSAGLLAASWAAMVSLGREGYLRYARAIFETSFAMQDHVRSHAELRLMGDPTFCFSFTADPFDVYHVNDHMVDRGWRFNGQQYPNAIHMCVTRPQTQPGVLDRFATDLRDAVAYAHQHASEAPVTGAIYGGLPPGVPVEFVTNALADIIDASLDLPEID